MSVKEFLRKLHRALSKQSKHNLAVAIPLPLSDGVSEAELFQLTTSVRVNDAPELGQYIFVRAANNNGTTAKRPNWLYRSYPAGELI